MYAFPVTVIDAAGKRHEFEQLAASRRVAESLVFEHFGEVRYVFVRSPA